MSKEDLMKKLTPQIFYINGVRCVQIAGCYMNEKLFLDVAKRIASKCKTKNTQNK